MFEWLVAELNQAGEVAARKFFRALSNHDGPHKARAEQGLKM